MDEPTFGQLLCDRLVYWQRVLRLQDWTVGVTIVRHGELIKHTTDDVVGESKIYPHRKDAIITVVHPMDLPYVSRYYLGQESRDYDLTLVHELLRLHFVHPSEDPTADYVLQHEQALNTISRAMVGLYREGHPLKQPTTQELPEPDIDVMVPLPSTALPHEAVSQTGHYV